MSNFNETPGGPVPPIGAAPSPFGAPAPPPPPTYATPGYATPGFPVGGVPASKPPRPAVRVGALLLSAGGALMIVGSFLNWYTIYGMKVTGFSKSEDGSYNDGPVFLVIGLVLLAFGIAQLAARKVLAVGILAIIVALLGIWAVLVDIGDVRDFVDLANDSAIVSAGAGLWIILAGALVGLAGAIATVAKRRR